MILYICDRKVPYCCESPWCYKECYYTKNPEHARYGEVNGKPEWYPERFVKHEYHNMPTREFWFEKKRW